uniref:Uncharacterized protein n=1 Tax=Oryza sativa subsp. japonica TaxID=39947 RepID=Q8LHU7_ORYSJ|nr:hypothetical protein [Oryza sativa Japonica Group]
MRRHMWKEDNGVLEVLEFVGVFVIMTNVVPINDQDSRINNYGFTEEDNLSHLDCHDRK